VMMFGAVSAVLAIALGLKAVPAGLLGVGVSVGIVVLVAWGKRRKRARS
jgi:hypothetical protein